MLKLGDIVITHNNLHGVVSAISTGTLIDTVIIMLSHPISSKNPYLTKHTYSVSGTSVVGVSLNVKEVVGNIFNLKGKNQDD
jgi:hypothetical protein